MHALRVLKREAKSAFTFVSERGAPFTVSGLQKLIERAGNAAKIGFKVHMHTAKTIPPAVVANALRSSAGANKHESGAHTDPEAPLHLALAGQSIPFSSWRRRRVQLLAIAVKRRLLQSALTRSTDGSSATPPPCWTGRGGHLGLQGTPSKIPKTPKWGLKFSLTV